MIVIKAKFVTSPASEPGPVLTIEQEVDGYRIRRINVTPSPDLIIRASDMEPWDRKLFYWSYYGDGFIDAVGYENSRDYDGLMKSRFGCPEGPVLIAARGGSGELVLVSRVPTYTQLPYQYYDLPGPSIEAVEFAVPGYGNSARAIANKAKRNLLGKISPLDSQAELEKQVDLLSLLVVQLADQLSVEQQPDWYQDFKSTLTQHSSLQFKGAVDALADVSERKAQIRAIQQQYFNEREGN